MLMLVWVHLEAAHSQFPQSFEFTSHSVTNETVRHSSPLEYRPCTSTKTAITLT